MKKTKFILFATALVILELTAIFNLYNVWYIRRLDHIASSEGINSRNFAEIAELIKNIPGTKKVLLLNGSGSLYGNERVVRVDRREHKSVVELHFDDGVNLKNRIAVISYNFPGPTDLSGTFIFATFTVGKELLGKGYQRSQLAISLTDFNNRRMRGSRLPVSEKGKSFALLRPTTSEPITMGISDTGFDITRVRTISVEFVIGRYPDSFIKFPVHGKIYFDDIYAFNNIDILADRFKKVDSRRITIDGLNIGYKIRRHFWKNKEDKESFILGMNYPWQNYGWDFGKNPYGKPEKTGFSSRPGKLEEDFLKMKKEGIDLVRIFVFCDFRTGLVFENGRVKKFDQYVWDDVETLISVAGKTGIKIIPVLLDFGIADGLGWDVMLGEHPELIFYDQRSVFLTDVLGPLLVAMDEWNKEYGEPVYAIELMNEPENMAMLILPRYFESLRNLFIDMTNIIHRETSFKVTLGSKSIVDMQRWWKGVDIDIWQYHFYEHMALEHESTPLNLNRKDVNFPGKIICGEIYPRDLERNIFKIKENGYDAAVIWAWQSGEGLGILRKKELEDEFKSFAEKLKKAE